MSARVIYPLPTHSVGYTVERSIHPLDHCGECRDWAEACARTAALVGQANGGGYLTDTSPDGYRRFHGASVIRADLGMDLRRAHTCQIRTTTTLDSPLCAKPATSTIDNWGTILWTCPEHARNDAIASPISVMGTRAHRRAFQEAARKARPF
ncbi:hypothetical protein QDA02_gp92 [Microbacterium phage Margaery]|uniref:Uncharacterized protein n=1 Tax=Microbacterium phage Margaery TaxID=2591217 RepID=A0A514DHJ3_9CAUD|nr:hypothetical protein QDA02_gp92 [Microbacterium phage Margaery]QDH93073.1 hypothetical protein PBI_MARGAERY_16 [Microbacterium phage Margaery]